VDGGRYPVKRALGEELVVEADIIADGHDVLRAMLLHRPPGEVMWSEIELAPQGNDVWRAQLVANELGRHHYTVLAWVDAFASWRRGLERKVEAGVDVGVELLEGALLVEAAATRCGEAALARFARGLRDPQCDRIALALGDELAALMARAPDR